MYKYADISTNKFFTFQANIGFEPDEVKLLEIMYYNNGSDAGTYSLTSDLFMYDGQVGHLFRENTRVNPSTHCLSGPINGRTYTFNIVETSGGTNATGKINIVLEFKKCGQKSEY